MNCPPLRCVPVLKAKPWGGRRLQHDLGKDLAPDLPFGESWEVADLPEGSSSIAGGPFDGMSLSFVMENWRHLLVPSGKDRFPLLVKFLDVWDRISIQVHPSAEVCSTTFPDENPKNETWIILQAEPEARVLHGLRDRISVAELKRHMETGTIIDAMHSLEVRAGDIIHVPAGTLHGIIGPILLLEVQDPSDSTFRVYDHGRMGREGDTRPLHIAEALQCIRHSSQMAVLTPRRKFTEWGTQETLVDTPTYHLERWTLEEACQWAPRDDAPVTMSVVAGSVRLSSSSLAMGLRSGQTCIVPPTVDLELTARGPGHSAQVIIAWPNSKATN